MDDQSLLLITSASEELIVDDVEHPSRRRRGSFPLRLSHCPAHWASDTPIPEQWAKLVECSTPDRTAQQASQAAHENYSPI